MQPAYACSVRGLRSRARTRPFTWASLALMTAYPLAMTIIADEAESRRANRTTPASAHRLRLHSPAGLTHPEPSSDIRHPSSGTSHNAADASLPNSQRNGNVGVVSCLSANRGALPTVKFGMAVLPYTPFTRCPGRIRMRSRVFAALLCGLTLSMPSHTRANAAIAGVGGGSAPVADPPIGRRSGSAPHPRPFTYAAC